MLRASTAEQGGTLAQERRRRLLGAMADAGIEHIVLYGNAWQGDYLRYAADFAILEGHGIGMYCDSKPHLLEDVDTPLAPGMALIVHPNTYHPEAGYIVLGDAVLVTNEGAEVLCGTPRDLFEVAV